MRFHKVHLGSKLCGLLQLLRRFLVFDAVNCIALKPLRALTFNHFGDKVLVADSLLRESFVITSSVASLRAQRSVVHSRIVAIGMNQRGELI